VREVPCRGRAAGDAVAAKTCAAERGDSRAQQLVGGAQLLRNTGVAAAAVTRIAADPGHLEPGNASDLSRDGDRTVDGRLAGPVHADVELDQHLCGEPAPVQGRAEALGRSPAVQRDGELDAGGGDVGEPLPLRLSERRIVEEDLRHTGLLEHLRLAALRHGEAGGPELELAPADLRRLVRLGVRPERDAVLVRVRLQVGEVGVEAVEVDHRDRRLDVGQ